MKKKVQVVSLLDDLRNQDPKKRLYSVQSIKQIVIALGPLKTRTDFLQYLTQFIDDEQTIVLQLLNQLQDFSTYLGGQEHQKTLLPLLISFCKTDQKKQASKSTQIIQNILKKNKQLILDVIKKIIKTQMNTSKQSAIRLISQLISIIPQNQTQLLQIYSGLIFSDIPSYKIISTKYLNKILQSVKNKQQIGKLIQVIFNDNQDLPKIYSLQALINYYSINNNLSLSKFKGLFILNNWRINIKICELIPLAFKIFSKANFKATFESNLLKFLSSNQPQLRSKACLVLKNLASIMSDQQIKSKLIPLVKKLAIDPVEYVKIEFSKNIVSLVQICSQSIVNQQILPIILSFIKTNQYAVGIVKSFQVMTKKVPIQLIQQKILTPVICQFLTTDNWRIKCQLIQLFNNVINSSLFLNDKMTTFLLGLTTDRINAVRQKATQLIINVICQQSPQWCDTMLIPKLKNLRQSNNYIERQIMLHIIQKTYQKVTQKTLNDVYKVTLINNLTDKTPNVRAKALKVLKLNKKILDKNIQKCIQKLKSDNDYEVRELAISIKS